MKQILQNLETGTIEVAELPSPSAGGGGAVVPHPLYAGLRRSQSPLNFKSQLPCAGCLVFLVPHTN